MAQLFGGQHTAGGGERHVIAGVGDAVGRVGQTAQFPGGRRPFAHRAGGDDGSHRGIAGGVQRQGRVVGDDDAVQVPGGGGEVAAVGQVPFQVVGRWQGGSDQVDGTGPLGRAVDGAADDLRSAELVADPLFPLTRATAVQWRLP